MKKMILMAAILCGVSAFADDPEIEYQMLYWQVTEDSRGADQATGARMYAVVSEGERINLGGSRTEVGQATGVINMSDFSSLGFDKVQASYYFELFSADGLILSTSDGFTYANLLAAYAFDITYADSMTAPVVHSAPFSAITVPEPTSGLLMLLGFAGLALKRKRV